MSNVTEQTPHERHVAAGFCPSVASTKAWCSLNGGHSGRHTAPYLRQDGGQVPLFWERDGDTPQ